MAFADLLPVKLPRLGSLPRLQGSRNLLRGAWNLLAGMPAGKLLFSRLVGRAAPYSGALHATVTVLRAGYAEVQMRDRRAVRNHLDCVHPMALANLAELAGNLALVYSLPDDAYVLVTGLDIEYMKKARGTITAVGEPPVPRTAVRAQYAVPVKLRDADGEEVARAILHSLVGPKPGSASDHAGDVN